MTQRDLFDIPSDARSKPTCGDPTREEMLDALRVNYGDDLELFSAEEAMYWFAVDWHQGQDTNLYAHASTSPFQPGMSANGPSEGYASWYYEELCMCFTSACEGLRQA